MSARKGVLVLGYGNPGRQDDGLGPAAAAEIADLRWPDVTAHDNYQLVIEDAVDLAEHSVVWFVDAARDGAEPYDVRPLWPAPNVTFTSHLLKPEALLEICRTYYGKMPHAYQLGIRGYEFAFLEGLTENARRNLASAVAMLREKIGSVIEVPP